MNLYAYVGNDPVNFMDPWGLEAVPGGPIPIPNDLPSLPDPVDTITVVVGGISRSEFFGLYLPFMMDGGGGGGGGAFRATNGQAPAAAEEDEIVVVAPSFEDWCHQFGANSRACSEAAVRRASREGLPQFAGIVVFQDPNPNLSSPFTYGSLVLGAHKVWLAWPNRLRSGGWTSQAILNTIRNGQSYAVRNNPNPSNGATLYMEPGGTGRFVVVDYVTGEVLMVSRPGQIPPAPGGA